jgi:hypothetical protein
MRDQEFRDALTRASQEEVAEGEETSALEWNRWTP